MLVLVSQIALRILQKSREQKAGKEISQVAERVRVADQTTTKYGSKDDFDLDNVVLGLYRYIFSSDMPSRCKIQGALRTDHA